MTALSARIEAMPLEQLSDVLASLMNDHRPEADMVFQAAIDSAQSRMTSAEFIALCNQLEDAA